ncbi:DUF4158 domain-containing protein [Lapillicoccus sp.]|uniref:DUF4158 domain-containing protein n=1 Tax=Lapillicoccus sp. TaxID=1909287 RepID=UPI003450380D
MVHSKSTRCRARFKDSIHHEQCYSVEPWYPSPMTREMTRFEHRWEISEAGGWRDFAEVADELSLWIDRRAWTTGDGPKAIVDGALGWLRQQQVLLPGVGFADPVGEPGGGRGAPQVVGDAAGTDHRRAGAGATRTVGGRRG